VAKFLGFYLFIIMFLVVGGGGRDAGPPGGMPGDAGAPKKESFL